jgi:Bacterial regulatory proteins, gntR family/Periplasmic binding protein-like domain
MSKQREQLRRANETLGLLRRRIVTGHFPAGRQLPTRKELLKELQVSPVTLQRALDRLAHEGFVYSKGRGGTFVNDNPPHLSHIPLVFSQTPSNDVTQWSVLNRLLSAEAPSLADRRNRKISQYYGIDGHADNEDFQTLVREVQARRVSGLLFGSSPWQLKGTALVDEPGMPRVAITAKLNVHPAVESVSPNWDSFFERALEHFAARGRKRVAMLLKPGMLEDWGTTIDRKMTELGLTTQPYWQQFLGPPMAVRNCLHLLLNRSQTERPDALLITDDGWSEHAVAGLVAAGVRVPEELEVVAHCNFPAPGSRVLPFRRLGWEVRQFLETAVDRLDVQRESGTVGPGVRLAAVFEDEIEDFAANPAGYSH